MDLHATAIAENSLIETEACQIPIDIGSREPIMSGAHANETFPTFLFQQWVPFYSGRKTRAFRLATASKDSTEFAALKVSNTFMVKPSKVTLGPFDLDTSPNFAPQF